MLPMVPSQRENMIAWLAARCDPPDYGKLIVYEFPKEKLVYGPFQIEARINQNTKISQQISLWNQMGSRVIRGNLLVVPIENSILYVSPLYLRARDRPVARTQASDCRLWRPGGHGGDACLTRSLRCSEKPHRFTPLARAQGCPVSGGAGRQARGKRRSSHYNQAIAAPESRRLGGLWLPT